MPADPWDLVRQGWLATGSSGATDDPYRMSEEPHDRWDRRAWGPAATGCFSIAYGPRVRPCVPLSGPRNATVPKLVRDQAQHVNDTASAT